MMNHKKKSHCTVGFLGKLLLVIGGLNWGLVGVFDYNVVDAIFGAGSVVARIVYVLVGLAAIWGITLLAGKGCCGGKCSVHKSTENAPSA